jgi:membrane-bound lytic murein transglycosylase A
MKISPKSWIIILFFTFFIATVYRAYHTNPIQAVPQELSEEPKQIAPTPKMIKTSFNMLPAWNELKHAHSLHTFQKSCRVMLKKKPNEEITFGDKTLRNKTWFPVCQAALQLPENISHQEAKTFFEKHFVPKVWKEKPDTLFTGYYSPYIEGSLVKTKEYHYPIYATPNDLIFLNLRDFSADLPKKTIYGKVIKQHFVAYDSRQKIYKGSIQNKAEVLAWVKNPMDGLELEIQGAGIIHTPEKDLILNYAAQNGQSYRAIGRFLIQEGKLSRETVTMTTIRQYFEAHPEDIQRIFIKNPSFVFFKLMKEIAFYGYQNINLSPGYSLAVDKNFIPMGTPIFISTTLPNQHAFQRLMIAQDVGGAIKGPTRGDIYWGTGLKAKQLASDMKQAGDMWYLFPNIKE